MALSDDAVQLDALFDNFLTTLATAAAADAALQNAINNLPVLRTDALTKRDAAQADYNTFLRRIGAQSMTAQQRNQFRRIMGDLDDLNPAQLAGAVRRALGG